MARTLSCDRSNNLTTKKPEQNMNRHNFPIKLKNLAIYITLQFIFL